MFIIFATIIVVLFVNVNSFSVKQSSKTFKGCTLKMSNNIFETSSMNLAELFSSPTATYNGELIQQGLKRVPIAAKAADYDYGNVPNDAIPVLATLLILSVGIAAVVPYVLSIGEGAQAQQREREDINFIGDNQFAQRARAEKAKKASRKGSKN
mmetsp:Transcript_28346/g.27164  ORF Transcript_28346/g.27164 Transcript_28346/m.27164 type:complete len:154 (+) Transcript_28346:84-545(+)